jgi:sulfur carrier protein
MIALVNGAERELPSGTTVAALLDALGIGASDGIAVAHNERVVPRAQFAEREVAAGDRIEIIRAVAGG